MPASMTRLFIHYVWGTWQRTPWLVGPVRDVALCMLTAKCTEAQTQVLAINAIADHVHLLVKLPPQLAVAKLIADIKGASSSAINQEWPNETFNWQDGYGAFTVSESGLAAVRAYIATQQTHHGCEDLGIFPPRSA